MGDGSGLPAGSGPSVPTPGVVLAGGEFGPPELVAPGGLVPSGDAPSPADEATPGPGKDSEESDSSEHPVKERSPRSKIHGPYEDREKR